MLKKMGFSMEMMRTRKGFCEKAIVIVWHLVPASSQPSRGIDIGTHENMMVIIMTVMIIKIIFKRRTCFKSSSAISIFMIQMKMKVFQWL